MGRTWTSNNSTLSHHVHHDNDHDHRDNDRDHRDNDHDHDDNVDAEGSGGPASVGGDPSGGAPTEEVLASWRKSLEQVIFFIHILIVVILTILKIIIFKINHKLLSHC